MEQLVDGQVVFLTGECPFCGEDYEKERVGQLHGCAQEVATVGGGGDGADGGR